MCLQEAFIAFHILTDVSLSRQLFAYSIFGSANLFSLTANDRLRTAETKLLAVIINPRGCLQFHLVRFNVRGTAVYSKKLIKMNTATTVAVGTNRKIKCGLLIIRGRHAVMK